MSGVNHNDSFTELLEAYRARRIMNNPNAEVFLAQNILLALPEDQDIGCTICTKIGTDKVLIAALPGVATQHIYFTAPNICWISKEIREQYTDDDLRRILATGGVYSDILFSELWLHQIRDRSLMELIDQNKAECVNYVHTTTAFSPVVLDELHLELAGYVTEHTNVNTILVLPIHDEFYAYLSDTTSIWLYPSGPIPIDVIIALTDKLGPNINDFNMTSKAIDPFTKFYIPSTDEDLINIEPDTETDKPQSTDALTIDPVHDRIFNSGVTFVQGLDMLVGAMSRDPQVANLLRTRLVSK